MSVRIGIVGCGVIYATHAQAIQRIPDADISGFFDLEPDRAKAASERFSRPAFQTLSALCEQSDAVSICVPSGLHAEVGIEAARLKKHVLVEKPIEIGIEAASLLVEAAKQNSVYLSVISQHRFAPDIQRVRQALQSGEMGDPIQGDAYIKWYRTQKYYDSGAWRGTWALDGGGCLMNQGIHYIDMIQWIMGGVRSVQARVRTAAHQIEVEDVAAALVEYHSGALGVIQGSTSFFPGFSEKLEVHGRHGSVLIEGDVATTWEIDDQHETDSSLYGRGVQMQPTPNLRSATAVPAEPPLDPADRWIEQHKLQIADFVESVQTGRPPAITGEMALEPLKVILAIYKSARENGRQVFVEEIVP